MLDRAFLRAQPAEADCAYKPSGAGGGDVGLLFAPDDATLENTARRMETAGYGWLGLSVEPEGVSVHRLERLR